MARKPLTYFQVYPDDALAAIYRTGETAEVTGARFRLWCVACRERWPGTLPDDDAKLAAWAGLEPSDWTRVKPMLVASWQRNKSKTRWVIRRIREQLKHVDDLRQHGRRGAAIRWSKGDKAHGGPLGDGHMRGQWPRPMPNDGIPAPAPTPAPTPAKRKTPKRERIPRHSYLAEFLLFWESYPRREGKWAAQEAWKKHHPPIDECLTALAWQKQSDAWQKDGGEFIPHPKTWINQHRWEDQPTQVDGVRAKPKSQASFENVGRMLDEQE